MRPLTPHWADQAAARVVAQLGDREQYTVASGITPSGTVHIGNFREVITVDLVARALKDLGKKVRFIYSWDNFDTFRKVPANLPEQEMLAGELKRSIARIPDPYHQHESYAAGNIARFEAELEQVGCDPEFLYQEARYSSGIYAESMRIALEKRDVIVEILNKYRATPLADSWSPAAIYCEKCGRDDMREQGYKGEWDYHYACATCGNEDTVDIRKTKNLKLNWRTDWPMRWAYEGVDFEPGGKDHSSQGGSYDTAKQIVKEVYGKEPPIYLQYDFVSIKGMGGKMSSSSGNLISLGEALEIYDGQMIRWIFACQRPNHDFSLAFDSDVIKIYDEFDRAEYQALSESSENANKKVEMIKRNYDLSLVNSRKPSGPVFRPAFRELCNRLQISDGDAERTLEKYYREDVTTPEERELFLSRCKRAWNWLEKYAPEEFCYRLNASPVQVSMTETESKAVDSLVGLISKCDLNAIDTKELNQSIYDDVIRATEVDAKEFFRVVYQKLINRDQGPRLPSFLKEIGAERLKNLLQGV